jgi:ribosome-binding factor A
MKAAPGRRPERVAERIRSELMDLFVRGLVRDPAAADCCVTSVKMSDDLKIAKVYVRLLRGDVDAAMRARSIAGLKRAAPFIRRELSPRLELRYHPELRFYWDDEIDRATRIESLLSEIGREGSKS